VCKGLARVAEDEVRNTGRKFPIPFLQRILYELSKLTPFVGFMFHRLLEKLFDKLLDKLRRTLVLNVEVFLDLVVSRT